MKTTDKDYPQISVIIPIRPGGKMEAAFEALRCVDYPASLVEVIISYGFSPSRQRNEAAKKAGGEIVYFIDNDAEIDEQSFKRVVSVFRGKNRTVKIPQTRGFSLLPPLVSEWIEERFFTGVVYQGEIGAVGGPNVWWRKESFWPSVTGIILESFFAHFLMAARYRPIGQIRRASEKELILCNLAIKRSVFQKTGGFAEALYPNEENELLNRMEKLGYQLIYHPGVLISRSRRETPGEILRAFFHYGRGRMEQMRIEGISASLIFLAPAIFVAYLILLVFFHPWWAFIPFFLYLAAAFFSALGFAVRRRKAYLSLILPLAFLGAHLIYALGLLIGGLTNLRKRQRSAKRKKINLVKIKRFGRKW